MKFLLIHLMAFTSLNCFAANFFSTTQSSIIDSLQCRPDRDPNRIINAFKNLGKQKSALSKIGIKYTHEGEEIDEKIIITFQSSFQVHSAKSNQAFFSLSDGNFITYGDFQGDPNFIIEKLKLRPIDAENKGDYISGPVFDPKKDQCVPVIRLRKKGKNEFRLGCGWCNG